MLSQLTIAELTVKFDEPSLLELSIMQMFSRVKKKTIKST